MGKLSRLGNRLYDGRTSIDFVGKRWLWYSISAVVIVAAIGGLWFKGLNLGIEFEGGTEYSVSLPHNQVTQDNVDKIRSAVAESGIEGAASPIVTTTGTSAITVQTEALGSANAEKLATTIADLMKINPTTDISTTEVGASWGAQVANRALTGLIVFIVIVLLFIWAYFREWKMSVAAIVALLHDIIITAGLYALSGFEVTPATVTGFLTILGFSLYDTVVVFDKVKENTRNLRQKRQTYTQLANLAINQTLVRSINTTVVAVLPVGALLYVGIGTLGSGALKDLALALFIGMVAGAYSSIFIATPLAVQLKAREHDIAASDARARARQRRDVDRYADVPTFADGMPAHDAPEGAEDHEPGDDSGVRGTGGSWQAPPRRPSASGTGRVVPGPKAPVQQSGAAKRNQPSRQPRSKRSK